MKQIFGVLFILSGLVLFFTIRKCKNIKNPMIDSMRFLFYSAIIATLSNLITLFSQNSILSSIFYSFFFIGIDGIIFFLFTFALHYTNIQLSKKKLATILFVILSADALNMLLNILFGHAFGIKEVFYNESLYLLADHYLLYNIHLILSYSVIGIVFLLLVYKAIVSPKIYKLKYLSLLIAFGLVTIADAFYVFLHLPIDFSVILFSSTGVVFYYITFHFMPHALIERSLSLVVENLDHAIIFFDNNGNCIYKNKSSEDLLKKYQNSGIIPEYNTLEEWCNNNLLKDQFAYGLQDKEINKVIEINGHNHYLNIKFRTLEDEKEKYIGSFFLIQDKTRDEEKIKYQKYLSTHDTLTGLFNKYYFYDKAQQIIKKNPDSKYVMICTKISNFKFMNEIFGNYVVDQFLLKYSKELTKQLSNSNCFARLDNDVFAILMEKDKCKIEDLISINRGFSKISLDKYFPIRFQVGYYEIEDNHTPISIVCDRANMAAASISALSTEEVGYFNIEMKNRLFFEQTIISDFSKAIQEKQFKIFIQPQFNLENKRYGAEVLARWYHPTEGLLSPDQFIYLFEDNGIITQLDMYIWEETAKILKKWKDEYNNPISLSVNISPKDFCYIDIYDFFTDLVKKYNIEPSQIKLEITETALLIDTKTQNSIIKKLKDAGFIIILDDFGTGYSSLNIVRDVLFDEIKLDLSHYVQSDNKARTKRIVSTVLQLAANLGIPTVAEGVENQEQYDLLKQYGCNLFQGFYLEKPLDAAYFEKKYISKE